MAVTLAKLKSYVRLDEDAPEDEQLVLKVCLDAAIAWFEIAGVSSETDNPLYDLGVQMLALSWFENRGADTAENLKPVPQGVYAIKHMLCALPDA